jgi:hypothetical protein
VNPGIIKTVTLLQQCGFNTVDSGDGKTHEFECDRENAYVSMTVEPEKLVVESNRLAQVLAARGIVVHEVNDESKPYIQGSYCPITKTAIIDLQHVSDKDLR